MSEGREYRRGVDKLFKVQSLEQRGEDGRGGRKGNFLLFASLAILKMRKKNHFGSSWNETLITDV